MRPRRRKPGESIKDYRAMVKRMEERFSGRSSTSTPKRSQSDPKYNPLFRKKVTPELKAQIDRQIRLRKKYEEYNKKKREEYLALAPAERKAFLNDFKKQNTIEEENRIRKKNRVEHSTPLRNLKPTQTKPYIARPPKKASTSSLGKLFSKAKPASTRTPTSLFGSVARGPKKYNQAAYLSGLNTPSNTKKQSIYKPYAKGGGIRKPKYKD